MYILIYVFSGVVQGMVTGMRGLCNGLGPAMFGVVFYLFHVDLNDDHHSSSHSIDQVLIQNSSTQHLANGIINDEYSHLLPGPPFVIGAFMVVIAIIVAIFIPEAPSDVNRRTSGENKKEKIDI